MQQQQLAMQYEGGPAGQFGYAPGGSYNSGRPGKRPRFGQGSMGQGQGQGGDCGQGYGGEQQQLPQPEENPRFRRDSDDEGGD